MRILHWNDGYYPHIGGTEMLVRDLCHAQQAAGHEVTVVARALPGSPAEEEMSGIPVWRRPTLDEALVKQPGLLVEQVKACAGYKRRFAPDLVHIHGSRMAGWLHLLSREAAPCPAVITLHAPLHLPAQVQRRLLRGVDGVAVVSASLLGEFASFMEERTGVVQVVPNGVAPVPHPCDPPRKVATVLALGRMVREKGFDIALQAVAKLPEIRLLLAGDGTELPGLRQMAHELGMAEKVEFLGWVHPESVPSLMARADVVLVPSRWQEPFGLVAVQAAQMARPVIASRVGGLPEIIRHEETGLLVPPEDPDALAMALQAVKDNPELTTRLGQNARTHAETCFTIGRCAATYEEFYQRAATGAP